MKSLKKNTFDLKINTKNIREKLLSLEQELKNIDGSFIGDSVNCPLKHSFTDGIYVREIFIPKGTVLTGKIHKHEHPNFLMSGEVLVVTEEKGEEYLKAPLSIISKAGTKRALYAISSVVWVTIHNNPTNTRDLNELEKIIIAKDYDEYAKHIDNSNSFVFKLKNLLIKKLSKCLG